jgi:hypothetical protein
MERITRGFNNNNNNNNNNKATKALFLDIERALDRVWTTVLIAKLITLKDPPPLIQIIQNCLQNRSVSVMHRKSY